MSFVHVVIGVGCLFVQEYSADDHYSVYSKGIFMYNYRSRDGNATYSTANNTITVFLGFGDSSVYLISAGLASTVKINVVRSNTLFSLFKIKLL